MDIRTIGERLEAKTELDRYAGPLHDKVTELLPKGPAKDALHGVWLGHPLHPMLTDLPIGFWTSAFFVDIYGIIGGRKSRHAADALIGLGVLTALPTAAAGAADWSELNTPERRSGLVHAAANVAATSLYAMSFIARKRKRRIRGIALSMAGATVATVGGFLGGHLSFRRAAGVNHANDAPAASDWVKASLDGEIDAEQPTLGHVDDQPIVAGVDGHGQPGALFARCSHLGGPLEEGELVDGCVRCPWHGSTFDMSDGTAVHGPATSPQPAYELRYTGDEHEARRRLLP